MNTTYSEKLKHPRWQKKRLEILQRDRFRCRLCGDEETTLHIHHLTYVGDPWEAPLDQLITLCQHCHSIVETKKIDPVTDLSAIKSVDSDGDAFVFIFDTENRICLFGIEQNKPPVLVVGITDRRLKQLVHFIINYWLKNNLEHNLHDWKKHPNP